MNQKIGLPIDDDQEEEDEQPAGQQKGRVDALKHVDRVAGETGRSGGLGDKARRQVCVGAAAHGVDGL